MFNLILNVMENAVKTVSAYTEKVINANKRLKEEMNSFGAVRAVILLNAKVMKLDKEFKLILEESKKDKELYDVLLTYIRTTNKGGYRVFYTLQGLNKYVNNRAKAGKEEVENVAVEVTAA